MRVTNSDDFSRNPFINQVNSDIALCCEYTEYADGRNPFINQVNSDNFVTLTEEDGDEPSQSLHKSGQFGRRADGKDY